MNRTFFFVLVMAASGIPALAQGGGIVPWVEAKKPRPDLLKRVDIEQRLNAQVPLSLRFRDEDGRDVALGTYFGRKPVAMALVYYECPMLCTRALNGQVRAYRTLQFDIGKDFDVVEVSINPLEKPVLAKAKKASYLDDYRRPGAQQGWHFLTGAEENIKALADAIGFHYAYDPESKQYAHATALLVLTPQGRIARYQYGVEYSARDLRFALVEAAKGRIGVPVLDKFLLYCFHYDPATGKYSLMVMNLVRAGAVLTCIAVFGFIFFASRVQRRFRRRHA